MRLPRTVLLLATTTALAAGALTAPVIASAATSPTRAEAAGWTGGEGKFTAVGPNRILDTRNGTGASGKVGAARSINLQVTGHGGVPTSGASTVVFNLTVTDQTASGHVIAYPTGVTRPTASNINFPAKTTIANLVTVRLGSSGRVTLYNSAGSVSLIADVVGWYGNSTTDSATGGAFQEARPQRLVDTRKTGSLSGRAYLTEPIDYSTATPNPNGNIRAVLVTLTAVSPQVSGHLTAWSGAGTEPNASVLNFPAGKTVPNLAVVPVAPCGSNCSGSSSTLPSIRVKNESDGVVDVLVDIWGFYDDGNLHTTNARRFIPTTSPIRIVDTRTNHGTTTLFTGSTRTVTSPSSVAGANTTTLVANVTAIPTKNTFLTLYRHGESQPSVSNLNPRANITVAGAAVTGVGLHNDFSIYNNSGTTEVIVDVAGRFDFETPPALQGAVAPQGFSSARALRPIVSND